MMDKNNVAQEHCMCETCYSSEIITTTFFVVQISHWTGRFLFIYPQLPLLTLNLNLLSLAPPPHRQTQILI